MTSDMIARIDAWIATNPNYVSRQDAVRRCVDLILSKDGASQSLVGATEPAIQAVVYKDAAD
ncbi:MAG: hypothetical protein WA842_14715 [Croceibacterium sp.]